MYSKFNSDKYIIYSVTLPRCSKFLWCSKELKKFLAIFFWCLLNYQNKTTKWCDILIV